MNERLRAFIAGGAGMGVAFGLVELVHGLYQLVPSVAVTVSQRVIGLMPSFITELAISLLGEADIPVLIFTTVVLTLAFAGLLALLALRSVIAALAGVVVLGAVGIASSFAEPFIDPVATVLTVVGALGVGVSVAGFLMFASDLLQVTPSQISKSGPQGYRSKETGGGIAVSRRNFVVISSAAAIAGVGAAGVGRLLNQESNRAESAGGGGTVSAAQETLPAAPAGASIDAPGMPPVFTPNEDFYLIDTTISPPRINRDAWTLKVTGAVDNPIEISYDDLLGFPTLERDITLSCISNEVGGGLVSNARWTGVLLSDVLEEAGLSRDKIGSASEQLVGRSADDWTAGFPADSAFDGREALVAFGMNGEELPADHGYPVRLVVPGLYGYVSATKWLTEIELTDWGFDAYWIQRNWSKEGPILTQSRIDTISDGDRLDAGTVQIGGVAWAPTRGIEKVEVSTDDGESWNDATLAAQLDVDAWRLWIFDWLSESGRHTIKVRATDGDGETQTEGEAAPHPSGATGYHTIDVTVR